MKKGGVIERKRSCKERKMPKKNSEQGKESKKGRTRKIKSFSKEKQENRRTRKTKSKRKIKKHVLYCKGNFFFIYTVYISTYSTVQYTLYTGTVQSGLA